MISYTTSDAVLSMGDTRSARNQERGLVDQIVVAVSRQLDNWLNQKFSFDTYTDQIFRYAQITPDGLLQCWPAVPTMSNPSAIAWKRSFDANWTDISSCVFEVDESNSGSCFRVITPNFIQYRTTNIQLKLSYTGGWATLNDVPSDFEYGCRRACWVEYKKRDQADQGKTAIPAMGIVVTPQSWPPDIKRTFTPFKRSVG